MSYTIIIGAGPAGLAMAGRLSKAGMAFDVLEQSQHIANSWHNHYRRLHLHTVKRYSNLPHRELPQSYPRYVPRAQLVAYYEQYARDLGIQPHFGQSLKRIRKVQEGWEVQTQDKTYRCDQVVLATGSNRRPVRPQWPGEAHFGGQILHSRDYRSAEAFRGKNVLVVGFGNTGAEIALDLHEQGARTFLSVRSPVNVVPRDFLGNSTQQSAMLLSSLPHSLGDALGSIFQRISIGDLSRYGLSKAPFAPARQQRETGKTPVMDIGTVAAIKRGDIRVFGALQAFEPGAVRFADGRRQELDAVVLATGYAADIAEFFDEPDAMLNRYDMPSALWFDEQPGLYFLGFDTYSNGLLWSIREDSGHILRHMQERSLTPASSPVQALAAAP
jgi:cation diffusion facilitator CzcD-associated flavoprotein CzcO